MNRFKLCVVWLKIVSVLFSAFGVAIAFFNQTALFQRAFGNQINPVFWGDAVLPQEALLFQRWSYGLLGATCVLVGILIFCVVHNAFAKKERWARNTLLLGVLAWFLIDEPLSLYFGVYFNAAFNLVLLVAVLVPLLLSWQEFKSKKSAA